MKEIPSEVDQFISQGIVDYAVRLISSGKEAEVFLAVKEKNGKPRQLVAVKVYKSRNNRSFKNRSDYAFEVVRSTRREARALQKKTRFGRKVDECIWQGREDSFQKILHQNGVRVPEILATGANATAMEFIGDEIAPAPKLIELKEKLSYPDRFLLMVLDQIEGMLVQNVVHGDLSPYNILVFKGKPWIIDFPQAVDVRKAPQGEWLLRRDVENVCSFFQKLGVNCDPILISQRMWEDYSNGWQLNWRDMLPSTLYVSGLPGLPFP